MRKLLQFRLRQGIRAVLYWLAIANIFVLAALGAIQKTGGPWDDQVREYAADAPKTILELQQYRQSHSIQISSKDGRKGIATLINLNPAVNAWYLLKVSWEHGAPE